MFPSGITEQDSKAFYRCCDDEAFSATTLDTTVPRAQQRPSFQHLFAFSTWQNCGLLALGLASALAIGGMKTGLAVVLGKIFVAIAGFGSGAASGQQTLDDIAHWCVVLAAAGAVAWLAYFAFMFAWITFGEQQARLIRVRMLHVLLKKDMAWFDRQEDGVDSLLVSIQT